MRTLKYLIIILTISHNLNSQTFKTILLDKNPKQVPEGKYWKVKRDTETKIQFSSGSFKSGTMCNALLFSNPHVATFLSYGTSPYNHDNSYMFLTDDATKIPYSNEKAFNFLIKSIVKSNFDLTKLQYSGLGSVSQPDIIILPGTYVRVGECIEYFEVQELVLTTEFLEKLNKEKELNAERENDQLEQETTDKANTKFSNLKNGKNPKGEDFDLFYLKNKDKIDITFQDSFPFKLYEVIYNIETEFKKTKFFRNHDYDIGNKNESINDLLQAYYDYKLHFDKNGTLYSISTKVIKDKYSEDYILPSTDFLNLKKYITTNGQGIISEKEIDYQVQFSENLKANYFIKRTKTYNLVEIKKNKAGEIKVLKRTKQGVDTKYNTDEELQKFLVNDDEIKKLERGTYKFKLIEEFENFEIKTRLEYKKINQTFKLGSRHYINFEDIITI